LRFARAADAAACPRASAERVQNEGVRGVIALVASAGASKCPRRAAIGGGASAPLYPTAISYVPDKILIADGQGSARYQ